MVRPLNERGREAVPVMGNFLKNKKIQPDLILSSPATRALDTAMGIARHVNYAPEKILIDKRIYFGGVKDILAIVNKLNDTLNDVFVFGHEPILSGLIYKLSGDPLAKFPTCAVYRMAFDIKKWNVLPAQQGKCEFFVYPKMLQNE
jgi:phosphohistidine phosphatase